MRPGRAILLLLSAVLVAGCGGLTDSAPTPKASLTVRSGDVPPDDEVIPSQAPATTSTSRSTADDGRVVLAFGGDIHFEEYLAPLARDPEALAPLADLWADADFRMANLETAITEGGTKVPKAFNFRAPASALTTLAHARLDALSMANNHGVDYGVAGLRDTLAAVATSPVPIVGIGANEKEAFAPRIIERAGLRIAVLGASQVSEQTLEQFSAGPSSGGIASAIPTDRLVAAVAAVRDQADVVVVYLHWGIDYQECADARSKATAADLEAAGADVIVGAHSHRVGGAGWLGDSYVAYGLGNFVWWRSAEPDSRTGILRLEIDPTRAKSPAGEWVGTIVRSADWQPLLIGRDGIPATPSASDEQRLHGLWEAATSCSGLSTTPPRG